MRTGSLKRRRKEKMGENEEICPFEDAKIYPITPWKCQERKGRSEGEKEDGQRKKEGEEEKGRENEGICPLENI
jgi:hypothetical protein